ncbi:hypothetical protein PIB30_071641 [Stylosanthes scabra]|uniref:Uncharacterized protein n=1 Tax=Stylosanthes scabra TaxID=79078 RepID=A0ABU6WM42_9FABA|nr:hypothetical protein [Stylosanthes scabra]
MIPLYNKQYYTQGWRDNQPNRWSPPQQQTQNRQQNTYSQPQNQQNQRYQPPHLRPNPPMNPPPASYDETLRTYQQEIRELREAHKRIEAHLNDLTELLHKFANKMAVNSQPPSNSNPLPSQPLPNPKGGIIMVQTTNDTTEEEDDEEEEEEEDEEDDEWLYDLLAKLVEIDSDSEDEYEDAEEEEVNEEDEEEETTESTKETTDKEVGSPYKEEEFFIANPTQAPISQEESEEESVVATKPKEAAKRTVTPKLKKNQKTPTPARRSKQKKEDIKTMKKKPEKGREERKSELNCTDFKDLLGKLKKIKSAIIMDGDIGVHLVEDNSKWK